MSILTVDWTRELVLRRREVNRRIDLLAGTNPMVAAQHRLGLITITQAFDTGALTANGFDTELTRLERRLNHDAVPA
ncbi:hypothetical protein [Herbiconiux daphne]|uniref:Uncharacterized protein n=1 Tax=Herbiconiux daphne TaxID=2970914 RepID=A0ABT2H785_9MICO|nr:hypothetical protein [Herbiconiux daphne]MCS5735802.1 hypothetical protein [Herbiconiux daphne]